MYILHVDLATNGWKGTPGQQKKVGREFVVR